MKVIKRKIQLSRLDWQLYCKK